MKMNSINRNALLLAGLGASALCTTTLLAGGVTLQPRAGDPLRGLTKQQTARFLEGQVAYQTPWGAATGLGPVMNKSNCASCHSNPLGGWGSIATTRFGMDEKGEFVELGGGSLLQILAVSDPCREILPLESTVVATRMTNASMAYGLIEAIPDAAIAANADDADADGDGVSGRVHWVLPLESSPSSPLRAGRFGWKSQVATVLSFSGDATRNELGVTNALIPSESAPNGDETLLGSCDSVADPEDIADANGRTFLHKVTDFQRYLAEPPQMPRAGMTGEGAFNAIGCNKCHIAQWTTANLPTLESAVRNKVIRPYSDFLVHDMGLLADGVQDGDATELEIRTPTLWNLRTRDPMLHDGSASGGTFADRVTAAIEAHGPFGEAAASAAAFAALPVATREHILAFLDSLGRDEYDINGDRTVGFDDLAELSSCRLQASFTPDSPCAVGDIDADGNIDSVDLDGVLLALAREGVDVSLDCDNDGTSNIAEIFLGAPDADFNGVPDNCVACPADLNGDGSVGGADLAALLNSWGSATNDLTGDGVVNGADLASLLNSWGGCN